MERGFRFEPLPGFARTGSLSFITAALTAYGRFFAEFLSTEL
jgi:hypothetical protein